MLAYQLVRRLMAAAAAKHWKKPTEISFLNAARWTLGFSKIMSMARTEDMPLLYERLLRAIAASKTRREVVLPACCAMIRQPSTPSTQSIGRYAIT